MKRYSNTGEVETISANIIFHIIDKLGVGNHINCDVYLRENNEREKSFVVDLGDAGRFGITKTNIVEEYELKNNDWILVEGTTYRYTSHSTTFNGAPYLRIQDTYDKIKNLIKK